MNSTETDRPANRIVREDIEWWELWLPNSNQHDLPRCLLIGDSITGAYYAEVTKALTGQAYVGRFSTSKSLGDSFFLLELELVLRQAKFDVVHFNNGMHGWDYTEDEFARDFPLALALIRRHAPGAKIIWGNITPVRVANDIEKFDARTERVKVRNEMAARYATAENIPINDMFGIGQDSSLYTADGVHFNPEGSRALAGQVAQSVRDALATL